jgi:DnaJ-class molecular chaperone
MVVKCNECKGRGKIRDSVIGQWSSTINFVKICTKCKGKGYKIIKKKHINKHRPKVTNI